MQRRHVLPALLFGTAGLALPLSANSLSQGRKARITMVTMAGQNTFASAVAEFIEGMRLFGYQQGQHYLFSQKFGNFSPDQCAQGIAQAIREGTDVFLTQGAATHNVAMQTRTIPVVALYSRDLFSAGLVTSLARPGKNITGIQLMALDLIGKRCELLREISPGLRHLAVISAPLLADEATVQAATTAVTKALSMKVVHYAVNDIPTLNSALIHARNAGAKGLLVFADHVTYSSRAQIAAFALQHKMPVMAGWDSFADAGALASYGPNIHASWRHAADFMVRILRGMPPAEIPVELPTTIDLVINLNSARRLGIVVPQSALLQATRLIT